MAPDAPTRTWTRPLAVVGGGAALVGSLAYVGLGNPHSADFVFPPCPFKALTGWNCPACGGLRMTHDLLHGDLAAAFVDNAFVLIGLPLLLAWMMLRRYRGQSAANTPVFVVVIVAAVAWTIVRNLPGFPLVPTVLTG
ncbi:MULTISPECIES: DUF2752 domain-containing protein [Mycobacteriaceae]|uniref:DUF2752 domain-containing protein n=1 Tax=Mycolicibacterium parafortuitum TaxID=39692 RepID=A0ACC6MPG8_MYCPF|nr:MULTISPECIES: DUF2752 domain-containing protein [Mycobacteriaceae]MDZ5088907.1 DUF2752 domain-containing protein [Mycolicibacterium parafortuitum]GFM20592.1 protein of unknown function (DUF2752) [Mycobacterium sp. PO1]GFM26735.1 protein of unknown function (DUF2752) [Mycobacterium sp. PO2]